MARFAELIAQQRDKHVLDRARPHLEQDESVLHWARACHPDKRRQGYAYLTDKRLLVVWTGGGDGHGHVSWEKMHSWGIDHDAGGGPELGVESERNRMFLQLPVGSRPTAARVTHFLREFASRAPSPTRGLVEGGRRRRFAPEPAEVVPERRSASAQTKRFLATFLGLLLIAVGLVITPVPGPWSLPIVLAGLAILSSEYDWAKDVLDWVRHKTKKTRDKLKARRAAR